MQNRPSVGSVSIPSGKFGETSTVALTFRRQPFGGRGRPGKTKMWLNYPSVIRPCINYPGSES